MAFWPVKDFAIALVFSESFLPMGKYLFPQMAGDLLRTVASAFSFFLLARGHIRVPLGFEFAQGLGLFIGFQLLAGNYSEMAPVYAHVATYLVLAGVLGAQLRRSFFPGGSTAL
jgi:PST family polysaccharide transporter/antigen flippase